MLAGRAVGFLLIFWPVCGVAWADAPAIPAWEKPRKDTCAFDHPDKVAAAITATTSCKAGTEIYFACEDRWFNNPEMEEAAVNVCDNEVAKLSDKLTERYEDRREDCILRYQAADMRILWSAVRNCRVRLARNWAKRYGRK